MTQLPLSLHSFLNKREGSGSPETSQGATKKIPLKNIQFVSANRSNSYTSTNQSPEPSPPQVTKIMVPKASNVEQAQRMLKIIGRNSPPLNDSKAQNKDISSFIGSNTFLGKKAIIAGIANRSPELPSNDPNNVRRVTVLKADSVKVGDRKSPSPPPSLVLKKKSFNSSADINSRDRSEKQAEDPRNILV